MKNFYLITNIEKDNELSTTNEIVEKIKKIGGTCEFQTMNCNRRGDIDITKIPENTECVLVLGGDGTLIKASRELVERRLPLIGINLGHLGYLAEIELKDIDDMLLKLYQDEFKVERRMMLKAEVLRNGEICHEGLALNDVVVGRSGTMRVLKCNVYVNGQYINHYSADGMIVSTPTGSTAYNLSAGGPIVEPCAEILVMTPVSPHTLLTRSIVLSEDSVIELEMCKPAYGEDQERAVYFDGVEPFALMTGDRIRISKSHLGTSIIHISELSFFETLQRKMG